MPEDSNNEVQIATSRESLPTLPSTPGWVLEKKIERFLKDVKLKTNFPTYPLPGLNNVFKNERSILFRSAWLFIVLSCIAACTYQGIERVQYYWSYPVVVDVYVQQMANISFPAITLCSQDFELVANRFLSEEVLRRHAPHPVPCKNRSQLLLHYELNHNVTPLWNSYLREPPQWITLSIEGVKNVSYTEDNFVMENGFCRTLKISEKFGYRGIMRPLRLRIHIPSLCRTYSWVRLAIHELNEEPYRKDFSADTIKNTLFTMELTKHVFLKRPGHDCKDAKTFSKCTKDCFATAIEAAVPCRHPFLSPRWSMPLCRESSHTSEAYRKDLIAVGLLDPATKCSCSRKCIQNSFLISVNELSGMKSVNSEKNVFSFLYRNNYITTFTERSAYTVISLLCDIGGNMGLYIGLSILSLCEIFQVLFNKHRHNMKSRFISKDMLYKKVEKMYKINKNDLSYDALRIKAALGIANIEKQNSYIKKVFWMTILLFNFVGSVWFIWNRIAFYLKMPVTTVVDVVGDGKVRFPDLISCPETRSIFDSKVAYARSHQMKSRCPVHFLDLLDLNINASALWDISNFHDIDMTEPVITPFGICRKFDVGLKVQSGKSAPWLVQSLRWDECYEVEKVYIKSPGEPFDLRNYRCIAANGHAAMITFTLKEYNVQLTTPNCLSTREASQCKYQCLARRLSESDLKCRLPYMPEINLPYCNRSSEAKEATKTYFSIYMETTSRKHCGCQRQCLNAIYESQVRMYTNFRKVKYPSLTRINIAFESVYTNVISEIPVYPFIKLLCDIGGILGIVLGLSLLNILDVIGLPVEFLFLKPASKPKPKIRIHAAIALRVP